MVDGDISQILQLHPFCLITTFFFDFLISFPKKLITTIYHYTRYTITQPLEFEFFLENFAKNNIS